MYSVNRIEYVYCEEERILSGLWGIPAGAYSSLEEHPGHNGLGESAMFVSIKVAVLGS